MLFLRILVDLSHDNYLSHKRSYPAPLHVQNPLDVDTQRSCGLLSRASIRPLDPPVSLCLARSSDLRGITTHRGTEHDGFGSVHRPRARQEALRFQVLEKKSYRGLFG